MQLVKTKIVFDKKGLTIYMWEKTFWIFGKWVASGTVKMDSSHRWAKMRAARITPYYVSELLNREFLNPTFDKLMSRSYA